MKICKRCHCEKDVSEFGIRKSSKDGRNDWCLACLSEYNKDYYIKNKDKILETTRQYAINNVEKRVAKAKEYYKTHWDERREYRRNYYETHKDVMLAQASVYRKQHRKEINIKLKEYTDNNPSYKIAKNLRTRLTALLKGKTKYFKVLDLIGCSAEYLKDHLESQFVEGMSWNNYGKGIGKWSIDHILPCDSFDLTNPEEQKRCFHWSNLQPLWYSKNSSKRNKII